MVGENGPPLDGWQVEPRPFVEPTDLTIPPTIELGEN